MNEAEVSFETIDSLKKSVSFHEVHIREFERIVGDNPAVSACPAVSIAWDHHSENTHKVDHVESLKSRTTWSVS